MTETPFSTTRTVLFSMLERGSFFLSFIFAYIPWLNLVVILATKHLLIKEREREREIEREEERSSNDEFNKNLLFFSSISIVHRMIAEDFGPRQ